MKRAAPAPRLIQVVKMAIIVMLWVSPLLAQVGGTISGMVTGPVGNAAVSGARISVTNISTSQTVEARSDSLGAYRVANLAPGSYSVTISAEGLGSKVQAVTLAAGASQTLNVQLSAPASPGAPTLSDLGFPTAQTQANPAEQARLDRRSHMLMVHQRLGLITAGALAATVISSFGAGGHSTSSTSRDLHVGLGAATAGLYFTTASYAIRAPKIAGTTTRGPIKLHKTLAWVHGTGMVLTPILGAMAFNEKSKGEKVHGIAQAHGPVAWVTTAAYGLAIASVSFKF